MEVYAKAEAGRSAAAAADPLLVLDPKTRELVAFGVFILSIMQ
jgi:hypothetical protein